MHSVSTMDCLFIFDTIHQYESFLWKITRKISTIEAYCMIVPSHNSVFIQYISVANSLRYVALFFHFEIMLDTIHFMKNF